MGGLRAHGQGGSYGRRGRLRRRVLSGRLRPSASAMVPFFDHLQQLLADGTPCVAVTVVDAVGSVPQDQGARMLVTEAGLHHGTVGGGKVEIRRIAEHVQSDEGLMSQLKAVGIVPGRTVHVGKNAGTSVEVSDDATTGTVATSVLHAVLAQTR